MNKPELISVSDFLMIDPLFDQKLLFRPEIEFAKGGLDALLQSGLIRKDDDTHELIEIIGQTAILTIEGPLRPGRDWFFSVGYGDIQDAIVELIDNDKITTVIQKIDSPGGTVKQAFETEEMFRELAKEKRLISLITGSATSAAALLTFPAHQRFIASKTAQTGSIGVVAEHIDNRIWYKEFFGEIRTSVAEGRLKDAGTDTKGFDAKAKEVFEGAIKKLFGIFIESAAVGLGVSREKIEAQESAVFIGTDGIEQGFADGFSTQNELIEQSNSTTVFSTPGRPAFSNHSQENNTMEPTEYKAKHPDGYQAVIEIGRAEGSPALKETHLADGKAAGILLERKRMNDIDALGLPAEYAKTAKGSDFSAEKVAANFMKEKAEKDTADLKAKKTEIEGELQDSLESDVPADAKSPDDKVIKNPIVEYEAAVLKAQDGGKVSKGQAMKYVKNSQPELHAAFIEKSNERGT